MKKNAVRQSIIGILLVLLVFTGCASGKSAKADFTPGVLKNDIGGEQNLSKVQFYLSEDISVNYTRTTRTQIAGKVVKVKTDTFSRTFKIKKKTAGVFRTQDNAKNPVTGWNMAISPYSGREIATIQLLFWKSNDNYLEFEAYYDENFDDKFTLFAVTFSDEKEKVPPITISLGESNVVTRETYIDIDGNHVSEPQFEGDIPVIQEIFSIQSATGEKPYIQYNLSEKQKVKEKAIKAPGRKT